jgi:hypothetical protein
MNNTRYSVPSTESLLALQPVRTLKGHLDSAIADRGIYEVMEVLTELVREQSELGNDSDLKQAWSQLTFELEHASKLAQWVEAEKIKAETNS